MAFTSHGAEQGIQGTCARDTRHCFGEERCHDAKDLQMRGGTNNWFEPIFQLVVQGRQEGHAPFTGRWKRLHRLGGQPVPKRRIVERCTYWDVPLAESSDVVVLPQTFMKLSGPAARFVGGSNPFESSRKKSDPTRSLIVPGPVIAQRRACCVKALVRRKILIGHPFSTDEFGTGACSGADVGRSLRCSSLNRKQP
jgi:hypothetical protein